MNSRNGLSDYAWLTGPEADQLLRDLSDSTAPLHTVISRLRRDFSAERVHLLVEQVELRRRAADKFACPEAMFFTRIGLEQATDEWIAVHKAQRFSERGTNADLCCGIGGDLLALGKRSLATGIDRDPIAVLLATANARALGTAAVVEISDVARYDVRDFAAWHVDPDRRPTGKRTTSLAWSSPGVGDVERLLDITPHAAVKLAPAAEVPHIWNPCCELEWISRDRVCRQQVAWHGNLAESIGQRRATILGKHGSVERTVVGLADLPVPFAPRLDRFLFEPDPAVLAARLSGVVAEQHGLQAFSSGIAYLTGPEAIDDPALTCFKVDDILPLKPRLIADALKHRGIGRLEIKKRGVEHEPVELRKQFKLTGDEAAVLILTQLHGKPSAIIAYRAYVHDTQYCLAPDS